MFIGGITFISIPVNAQVIPNFNFETWGNGANNAPDSWEDHGSKHPGFYPVTQSTDHCLGSYSAHIENNITATDTTPGTLESKGPNTLNGGWGPAFPVNTRYTTLKGFYKFTPQNGDSAVVIALLYKTGYINSQWPGNMLAIGWKNIGTATSVWTPFTTMNFLYDNATVVPDSAYISLDAFQELSFYTGVKYPVKGNSAFYVDALNYDSYLTGVDKPLDITSNFKLFPNATSGNFDVHFKTSESDYVSIKIYDMDGKEILNLFSGSLSSGEHVFHYNMEELSNGNYLYVVASEKGYKAEKLCVQK